MDSVKFCQKPFALIYQQQQQNKITEKYAWNNCCLNGSTYAIIIFTMLNEAFSLDSMTQK